MTQEEQQASSSSAPSPSIAPRRKQQKDIFGVQLDVTSRLLDAEKLKLTILQREIKQKRHLEGTKKEKELERQRNNLERFQIQHDRLEWEYEQAAFDMFKGYYTLKPHRSLPHLGLKQTPKTRENFCEGQPSLSCRHLYIRPTRHYNCKVVNMKHGNMETWRSILQYSHIIILL
ncbi:uncharacterized protein LOC117112357 isoform X2 [Anneissia japonica]|uniref:uncharacterized protein LOC117112357 isoform X2 n=1 Tax=Anneissia japonica TaxID=1529436 RepID=UPI0014256076|nr:uncharacterized protein LOC117112357 isoform X2 [Anneissia japonica]